MRIFLDGVLAASLSIGVKLGETIGWAPEDANGRGVDGDGLLCSFAFATSCFFFFSTLLFLSTLDDGVKSKAGKVRESLVES